VHLGNARTALLAWLDVRSRGGAMVLRVEDNDFTRARRDLDTAIRLKPDGALAYFHRGRLNIQAERLQDARRDLRTAQRLDPNLGGVKEAIARLEKKAGRSAQAAAEGVPEG